MDKQKILPMVLTVLLVGAITFSFQQYSKVSEREDLVQTRKDLFTHSLIALDNLSDMVKAGDGAGSSSLGALKSACGTFLKYTNEANIAEYDKVYNQAMKMSDALTNGIVSHKWWRFLI